MHGKRVCKGGGGSTTRLSFDALRAYPLYLPELAIQEEFVEKVQAWSSLEERRQEMARQVDDLFLVLLERGFQGRLTETWRQSHWQEAMQELEEQLQQLQE